MATKARMTLTFIFTTFLPEVSGSAIYNWERIQWFARQGDYRVVALVPDWGAEAPLPTVPPELQERLIIETYPSQPWPIYKLLRSPYPKAAKYIRSRLAAYAPDIVTVVDIERLFWFGTWHLPGRRYAQQRGIPFLNEYHTDYYSHLRTYPGGGVLREVMKPLTRFLYNQCTHSLAISPAAQHSLQRLGVTNALVLPMYGIDLKGFEPARRNRSHLHPWLSETERHHKVVLFIGRLAMEKRVDRLIEAFVILKQQYPQCSLFIAGDGPDEVVRLLQRLSKSTSHVHFLGFVEGETRANLLASCDAYCSPAPYETFGRTPIEAMASGIPVIAVNSGGVSDYIRDGFNGYLVETDNPNALSQAILGALETPDPKLLQRARRDASQFSIENACQNLHDFYQELLASQVSSEDSKSLINYS